MFKKTKYRIIMSIMLAMIITLVGTLAIIYLSSYRDLYQSNQEMLEIYISQYNQNGNPYEDNTQSEPEERTSGEDSNMQQREDPDFQATEGEGGGIPAAGGEIPVTEGEDAGIPESGDVGERTAQGPDAREENAPGNEDVPDPDDAQAYLLCTFYSVYFEDDEAVSIDRSSTVLYSDEQLGTFAKEILTLGKSDGIYGNFVYRVESQENADLVVMMDNTILGESITSLFRYTLIFGGIACVVIFLVAIVLAGNIVRPVEEGYAKQKQFISDAGHELKTPVAAIGANIETLSNEIGENRWLSNIWYENQRMSAMIRQLLLLSRTEGAPMEMTCVDFSQMLISEALSFEAIAYEKGYQISATQVEEGICVKGNESQLGQLLSILLDNAVEHASNRDAQDTDILLKLSKSRNRAIFVISNPGEEIPKKQKKMIFERFYRMDESRSGEESHFGLGLAIAKAIVETHHGSIAVDCEQGRVIFTVVLPLA